MFLDGGVAGGVYPRLQRITNHVMQGEDVNGRQTDRGWAMPQALPAQQLLPGITVDASTESSLLKLACQS